MAADHEQPRFMDARGNVGVPELPSDRPVRIAVGLIFAGPLLTVLSQVGIQAVIPYKDGGGSYYAYIVFGIKQSAWTCTDTSLDCSTFSIRLQALVLVAAISILWLLVGLMCVNRAPAGRMIATVGFGISLACFANYFVGPYPPAPIEIARAAAVEATCAWIISALWGQSGKRRFARRARKKR